MAKNELSVGQSISKLIREMRRRQPRHFIRIVKKGFNNRSKSSRRRWWQYVLAKYGKYDCSAFLLALPSDTIATRFFIDFGSDLDLLSGENCLIIAAGDFEDVSWEDAIELYINSGQAIEIARYFEIGFDNLPCLVVFENMFSNRHIIIGLKALSSDEIGTKLRRVFTVIQLTVSNHDDPLDALHKHLVEEEKDKNKDNLLNAIRSFAGKTYEIAVQSFILGTSAGP